MTRPRFHRMLAALSLSGAGYFALAPDFSPRSETLAVGCGRETAISQVFSYTFSVEAQAASTRTFQPHSLPWVSAKQQQSQGRPSGSSAENKDGLGSVTFPTSCRGDVQKPFERAVALLHSFVYDEAEAQFAEVFKKDAHCAIALWGEAMSIYYPLWFEPSPATVQRGEEFIQQAQRLHAATKRDRDYIDALAAFYEGSEKTDYDSRARAYARAMELLARRYPKDHEAAIFYALSLLSVPAPKEFPLANRTKAAEILLPLYTVLPNHPGVTHYLIHAYDTPKLAERGLPMAQHYADIAPAAAHALHMPSHIFILLGRWHDAINSNLAAEKSVGEGSHALPLHFLDFISYAYLQVGKEAEVQRIIEQITSGKPQLMPMMQTHASLLLAELPARYALETKDWAKASSLPLQDDASKSTQAVTYWARAIGAARGGDLSAARESLKQFETLESPSGLTDPEAHVQDLEATAWIDHRDHKEEEAIAAFQEADRIQHSSDTTAHDWMSATALEMLADLFLESNRPAEALRTYEAAMKLTPNRFDMLYGAALSATRTNKQELAHAYYEKLLENCTGSLSSRPELQEAREFMKNASRNH